MMKKIKGLIPIGNFAEVSRGIFRSAQPLHLYQYNWLKNVVGIDLIINLRSEEDLDEKIDIIPSITISVKDHHPPTMDQVEVFKALILNNKGKKILFHCEHGHGRTSTFCVILRMLEGWSLETALKEESERFYIEFKHKSQIEFLKTIKL